MGIAPPADGYGPIIERLQSVLIETIAPFARGDGRYALLDFPNHPNVGDSAIYVGEAILLERLFGRAPRLVTEADPAALDRIAALDPRVPLFLHGGGNFGDLWPRHQRFREAVMARFRDRRIVQLPQSIFYGDEAAIAGTARAIAGHPDLTLMVRDRRSEALAERSFDCRVLLAPDSAFMLGAIRPPVAADRDMLCLLRDDHERLAHGTEALARLPGPPLVVDWPSRPPPLSTAARADGAIRRRLAGPLPALMAPVYRRQAEARVAAGLALLSRGRLIVTDRLHAHILALLIGRPHIVLDNLYGKIAGFMDAWTADAAIPQVATLEVAVDVAGGSAA